MKSMQVALYARASSDQQNEAKTIESQLADLRARIATTGVPLAAELEFVDNGYSGATLIRPALERLRDVAVAGGIAQLYVHCPDRLARNYAHQVLLLIGNGPAGARMSARRTYPVRSDHTLFDRIWFLLDIAEAPRVEPAMAYLEVRLSTRLEGWKNFSIYAQKQRLDGPFEHASKRVLH